MVEMLEEVNAAASEHGQPGESCELPPGSGPQWRRPEVLKAKGKVLDILDGCQGKDCGHF